MPAHDGPIPRPLVASLAVALLLLGTSAFPPGPVVKCKSHNTDCVVTNAYGSFPDNSTCRVANVAYPSDEGELLRIVSAASVKKQHMKVITKYSHSIPPLSCPGGLSGKGLVISTEKLKKVVSVDKERHRMTVEAGIELHALIVAAASSGLALSQSPYWQGVTLGGLLSTGAHGSSVFGKGSAVHEYVLGMRLVVPSPEPVEGYYARIIDLEEGHPDLLAAKVSLGVLGVISRVTLQLEPMFKREVNNTVRDVDDGFEQNISMFANKFEYGDIIWYPQLHKLISHEDRKVPINTKGEGSNDFLPFRAQNLLLVGLLRSTEDLAEFWAERMGGVGERKCNWSKWVSDYLIKNGMGLRNKPNGNFTGYPVIGNQSDMQSAGSCLRSPKLRPLYSCGWDPRIYGLFYYQNTVSIPFSSIASLIADVKKLRNASSPYALCGIDLYFGFLMRFVRNSTAYLGKLHDSVDIDITYYRSHYTGKPRLFEDVMEEIEQMLLVKYNGLPHWGKNRNIAFSGIREKLGAKGDRFVSVMEKYDPEGLFSSDWTDAVLGLRGKSPVIVKKGCALEGLCVCSEDDHCAPEKGYHCVSGLVYKEAMVCRKNITARAES